MYPKEYRYTEEHEWVHVADGVATIGITDHAQDQLGDVVYVELPDVESQVEASQSFGTVESVKAVSDIYAPVSGEVVKVNESLVDKPEKINSDPHGAAWLIKVRMSDPSQIEPLMTAEKYQQYIAAETES
jgi:glycine cleavage system H protein